MTDALQPLWRRARSCWRLKLLLGFILPPVFMALYLIIQRMPLGVVRPVPLLVLDDLVPFRPDAVYLYESFWLLMGIAPWLHDSARALWRFMLVVCGITGVAWVIFLFWPMSSPRPPCPATANALYRGMIQVDNELNTFPSLHVALAVFNMLVCRLLLPQIPYRRVMLLALSCWTAGVVVTTMLTKQHAAVDVIGGLVLAGAGFVWYRRLMWPPAPAEVASRT